MTHEAARHALSSAGILGHQPVASPRPIRARDPRAAVDLHAGRGGLAHGERRRVEADGESATGALQRLENRDSPTSRAAKHLHGGNLAAVGRVVPGRSRRNRDEQPGGVLGVEHDRVARHRDDDEQRPERAEQAGARGRRREMARWICRVVDRGATNASCIAPPSPSSALRWQQPRSSGVPTGRRRRLRAHPPRSPRPRRRRRLP